MISKMNRFLYLLSMLFIFSNALRSQQSGQITDTRDNAVYKTIEINHQQWITQPIHWQCDQSYCCFDSVPFCSDYGRLYSWKAAQKACPVGYRLPKANDFRNLTGIFNGKEGFTAAIKQGWQIKAAGHKTSFGVYYDFGFYAHFWTSDAKELNATAFEINFLSYRTYFSDFGKDVSLSVICIKD